MEKEVLPIYYAEKLNELNGLCSSPINLKAKSSHFYQKSQSHISFIVTAKSYSYMSRCATKTTLYKTKASF